MGGSSQVPVRAATAPAPSGDRCAGDVEQPRTPAVAWAVSWRRSTCRTDLARAGPSNVEPGTRLRGTCRASQPRTPDGLV